ncbi:type IV pilin [Halarchaeum salinum]|uniref:Type IV pilin N-terminal domain-containing protein n=1 Tax=Halarchaeum salinum TaxID=489912 RepID=A0AAV3S5K4_9EURY
MKLTNILEADDRAVSPVIGVILMVAITVILAAVIGTFVLGLGNQVGNQSPQASFGFDFEETGLVTITHQGGDTIQSDATITVNATGDALSTTWGTPITAGDSKEFDKGSAWSGETVTVNWQGSGGDTSATLGSATAPDNA